MTVFWENDVEVEFSMTVSKKTNVKLDVVKAFIVKT